MTAYIAALTSAVCMTCIFLLDATMAHQTYRRPAQPLFVSSFFALLPVSIVFLPGWHLPPMTAMKMAFCAGTLLMAANWLYFFIVFSPAGETTETSAWSSGTIIAVLLFVAGMKFAGASIHDEITLRQWIGALLGGTGLVVLPFLGEQKTALQWRHRLMLIGFTCCGAAYELMVDQSLFLARQKLETDQAAFIAISPFFWLGFSSGMIVLLSRKERRAFVEAWPHIKGSWRHVFYAELASIIAFGTAVLGYAKGNVVIVALLSGVFPIFVMIGGIILRRTEYVDPEVFPPTKHPFKKGLAVALVILGSILATY